MQDAEKISRRNFLKLSGFALASLIAFPSGRRNFLYGLERKIITGLEKTALSGNLDATGFQEWTPHLQGRVIDPYIEIHSDPDFNSEIVKLAWRDSVVSILDVFYNATTDSHNKIWYQVEDGFAHSGSIQPVNTVLNEPATEIPPGGRLAEVTVPYSDAHWAVGREQPTAYRLYYQTTHWVVQHQFDSQGEDWYTLVEDKWDLRYFVPARHLRLIPDSELTPLSPDIPNPLKRLEVYLKQQILVALENQVAVFVARVATGGKFRDGDFSTQPGHYLTFHKRPSRHMASGNLAAGGYDLPGVPWICYFTESGVSFHGTYWHNNYGRTRSHGCINLSPQTAKWIYRWTLPEVPPNEHMVYKSYGTSLVIIDA
jgi:hypothetical protein